MTVPDDDWAAVNLSSSATRYQDLANYLKST
jgi:hypothetical protein